MEPHSGTCMYDLYCVFKSIENNEPTKVNIIKETIMGGMSCGEVSTVAWQILKNSSNNCLTIKDDAVSTVIAMLAEAKLSNEKIIAGECAVPGIIALISLFKNKDYINKLDLKSDSKILLFGCEGLTDKEMYKKLLEDGLKKI